MFVVEGEVIRSHLGFLPPVQHLALEADFDVCIAEKLGHPNSGPTGAWVFREHSSVVAFPIARVDVGEFRFHNASGFGHQPFGLGFGFQLGSPGAGTRGNPVGQ